MINIKNMQKRKRTRLTNKAIQKINSLGLLTTSQFRKIKMHKLINVKTEKTNEILITKEDYQLSFEEFKQLFAHSSLALVKYRSVKSAESLMLHEYHKAVWSAILSKKEGVHLSILDVFRFRTSYRKATLSYIKHFNIELD